MGWAHSTSVHLTETHFNSTLAYFKFAKSAWFYLVVVLPTMGCQTVDLWGLFVDVPNKTINQVVETVSHAVIQGRVEDHVRYLQLQVSLKQSTEILRFCVLQQEFEAAVDGVEEAIDNHLIDIVNVSFPCISVCRGLEEPKVLLKQKKSTRYFKSMFNTEGWQCYNSRTERSVTLIHIRYQVQGSKRKWGSTGFYGPVHLGRYWSVTSRHWSVYLQYLDRVADVKKQRIMLYKLF